MPAPPSPSSRRLSSAELYAALDLGTNNCRLLVAAQDNGSDKSKNALRVVDSFSRIVRLGEDVTATGALSEAAMERTLRALIQCKHKLDRHAVTHSRFVATEACRRASNAPAFLERVADEIDLRIEIISNEEEARLAFTGCASLLKPEAEHALVFDIGGGSTEILWTQVKPGSATPRIRDWLSLPYGVMNLSEQFGGGTSAELYFEEMVKHLTDRLLRFNEQNAITETIRKHHVQLLSTSGTVTTLAAIHLCLPRYDRAKIDGITLSVENIRGAVNLLLSMRPSERFHHPCIGSDRSDFIMSGCAIFEAITRLWPISHITIADRGVREGIILSFITGKSPC